jgi:hypothetical protein
MVVLKYFFLRTIFLSLFSITQFYLIPNLLFFYKLALLPTVTFPNHLYLIKFSIGIDCNCLLSGSSHFQIQYLIVSFPGYLSLLKPIYFEKIFLAPASISGLLSFKKETVRIFTNSFKLQELLKELYS